jgi:Flp pilus assembly protein TadG
MTMKSRLREERGAAAVEFAIILTVLVLILMAILEFGREYSRYQVFQGAAREGGRLATVRASTDEVIDRVYLASAPYEPSSAPAVSPGQCTIDTRGQAVTVGWDQEFHLNIAFWDEVTFTRSISAVFRCE